ncbi:hypothetical protein BHE74_00059033 [Ensete ventricosum]|nr:hypothetical protein BHE74_00059033 [Ensete ventricosum]
MTDEICPNQVQDTERKKKQISPLLADLERVADGAVPMVAAVDRGSSGRERPLEQRPWSSACGRWGEATTSDRLSWKTGDDVCDGKGGEEEVCLLVAAGGSERRRRDNDD